jgi:hypothetical protein
VESRSEVYYFKVIAVDLVGLKSDPSAAAMYVVSIGDYVSPFGQEFKVLPGDILEYQLVDIIDAKNRDPDTLMISFMGMTLQINSLLLFYVQSATDEQIIPVRGEIQRKWRNLTAEQLNLDYETVATGRDLFPFVATADVEYQKNLTELYIQRDLELLSRNEVRALFQYEQKKTLFFDWFTTTNVVVHTYFKTIDYNKEKLSSISFSYDSFIFVYDANTGVLIEMTQYNYGTDKGFSFKLIHTNVGLTYIAWWIIPLIIATILGIIAAIFNQIVKKLERRV